MDPLSLSRRISFVLFDTENGMRLTVLLQAKRHSIPLQAASATNPARHATGLMTPEPVRQVPEQRLKALARGAATVSSRDRTAGAGNAAPPTIAVIDVDPFRS